SINNDRKPNIEGLFWPNPKQIQEFDTTDQSGNTFNLNNLNEKWSFVFFGYTHCPDICPITMTVMNQVYTQLSTDYKNLQIIFVSVDPQRDTIEKLQQYVSYFNPDFYGLGGSSNKVDSLTKQIGVAYYLNNQNQAEGYLVDHTASIFIFDPKARLVGKLSAPHEAEKIKNQFIKIKEFIDAQS
ncbi:MAG: SCO family protein, partial [Pseudomonadota bacterium]